MIYAYNAPYHVPLKEYEGLMANREYWDDLGAEWNHSTLEQKLVRLAGFVRMGGNLKKVINHYAKDHDEEYNRRIQFCVLYYILKLMVGDRLQWYRKEPLVDRIKCLDKDELIKLLTLELKRDMQPSCEMDKNHSFHEHWRLLSDDQYFRRTEIWWSYRRYFW